MARETTSSTINLFLTGMAFSYFWAFVSLYPQIPGLYGPTGILPIHRLHKDYFPKSCFSMTWSDFQGNPSFFCLCNDLNVSPIYVMELLCLIGIVLSTICILSHFIRHNLTFIIFMLLWLLYLSLYLVGQTFLSFQWDILLLECGFLCCFICSSSILSRYNDIILFLVRWLLFRLMFASFIVKLQSGCPTWWSLTALDWHYESTCIPTPASWYFHNLPAWFNHISVVIMYIIEGVLAILFILPVHFGARHILRFTRLIAAYCNIILMILIQFTGNYNFFNLLTIIITCTCFDDEHLDYIQSKVLFWRHKQPKEEHSIDKYIMYTLYTLEIVVWIALIICTVHYFGLSLKRNDNASNYDGFYGGIVNILDRYHIDSSIAFRDKSMNIAASKFIMMAVILGYLNIVCCIIATFIADFSTFCGLLRGSRNRNRNRNDIDSDDKLSCFTIVFLFIVFVYRLICYIVTIGVGIYVFHASLVPFMQAIDEYHYTEQYVLPSKSMDYIRNELYYKSRSFHVVSSYGLFRRMTGVGGRPEVEVFVSGDDEPLLPFHERDILYPPTELKNVTMPWDKQDDDERGWYRIPFLYKPGDLNDIPGWIAPHQPRLDWQMWFAALSTYQNNAWFISFLYRLITPEQSSAVYDLIDARKYIYSPGFINHLKRQKEKQKKQEFSIMSNIYDAAMQFVKDLPQDNEFDDAEKRYYKASKDRQKKKRRKHRKKKKRKQSESEKMFEVMSYGYPKYITAILYDYHYTTIDSESSNVCYMDASADECSVNDVNKGIWWTRERKREYFPVFKYSKLDTIRDWMKSNGFLKRPVYDGESELSQIVKVIRFIRSFYRRIYHRQYDVAPLIHGMTIAVLAVRIVHELVQTGTLGRPLS